MRKERSEGKSLTHWYQKTMGDLAISFTGNVRERSHILQFGHVGKSFFRAVVRIILGEESNMAYSLR